MESQIGNLNLNDRQTSQPMNLRNIHTSSDVSGSNSINSVLNLNANSRENMPTMVQR